MKKGTLVKVVFVSWVMAMCGLVTWSYGRSAQATSGDAKLDAIEQRIAELEAENAALKKQRSPTPQTGPIEIRMPGFRPTLPGVYRAQGDNLNFVDDGTLRGDEMCFDGQTAQAWFMALSRGLQGAIERGNNAQTRPGQ